MLLLRIQNMRVHLNSHVKCVFVTKKILAIKLLKDIYSMDYNYAYCITVFSDATTEQCRSRQRKPHDHGKVVLGSG